MKGLFAKKNKPQPPKSPQQKSPKTLSQKSKSPIVSSEEEEISLVPVKKPRSGKPDPLMGKPKPEPPKSPIVSSEEEEISLIPARKLRRGKKAKAKK